MKLLSSLVFALLTILQLTLGLKAFAATERGFGTINILKALKVSKPTDVDFGTIVETKFGNCSIDPRSGVMSGSVCDPQGGTLGQFTISGSPNTSVVITTTDGVDGGVHFTPKLNKPNPTLGNDGEVKVNVGGTVWLKGVDEARAYNMEYTITINY